jgi:hypothetical protein
MPQWTSRKVPRVMTPLTTCLVGGVYILVLHSGAKGVLPPGSAVTLVGADKGILLALHHGSGPI